MWLVSVALPCTLRNNALQTFCCERPGAFLFFNFQCVPYHFKMQKYEILEK